MNPNELQQILDALSAADVREFSLHTGSYALELKRGPHPHTEAPAAPAMTPFAMPMPYPMGGFAPAAAAAPAAPAPAPASTPAAAPAPAPKADAEAAAPAPASKKNKAVTAPIVGTFYAAPSPDAAPYVKVGDSVQAGQVLCIIEAMKLMNEIEAEQGGTVTEILVKNGEPVEYGQTLFILE